MSDLKAFSEKYGIRPAIDGGMSPVEMSKALFQIAEVMAAKVEEAEAVLSGKPRPKVEAKADEEHKAKQHT